MSIEETWMNYVLSNFFHIKFLGLGNDMVEIFREDLRKYLGRQCHHIYINFKWIRKIY